MTAEALAAEAKESPFYFRLLLAVVMACASWGSLSAAVELVQVKHWFPWLVAFFIIEPIGLASGFATVFLIAPGTAIADWFAFFLKRAKVAMVLLATSFGLAIVIMLVLVACDQSP